VKFKWERYGIRERKEVKDEVLVKEKNEKQKKEKDRKER
jgi:hypothetical protein